MEILDWVTLVIFLGFVAWWMFRVFADERKKTEAFVEKETRQTQLYERLLEKLEDCEGC